MKSTMDLPWNIMSYGGKCTTSRINLVVNTNNNEHDEDEGSKLGFK